MKKIPKISEAEWRVMRVLWERAPRSANEVVEALEGQTDWNPRTTKTLLGRLIKKGALGFRKIERSYEYFPKVAETACVKAESRSFLDRVYGGTVRPMLAHFIEDAKLSAAEIEELKRLLERKRK
jgi:BlaI family penicillinase repressor